VQRHVLHVGEINDARRVAWCRRIEAFDEDGRQGRPIALFPEDRAAPALNCDVVHVRLSGLRLPRPPQWGACWLACHVWDQLRLDDFRSPRLPVSREETRWMDVLKTLGAHRLINPVASGDGIGIDLSRARWVIFRVPTSPWHTRTTCIVAWTSCRCTRQTVELPAAALEEGRWRDLFNADFDVLLYDLTSTYFEINTADGPKGDKRRHGYSRDKRPDCPQVLIALMVTPDGLPLAYECLLGNTADCTTLRMLLHKIEQQYGRGLNARQRSAGAVLGGNAEGRLSRLEKDLLAKPWQQAPDGVQVKLLATDRELYVFAESADRVTKERAMRKRPLKWLFERLRELATMKSRARRC
jgi:hypothetical protein